MRLQSQYNNDDHLRATEKKNRNKIIEQFLRCVQKIIDNCLNIIKKRDPRVSLKDGLDMGSLRRKMRIPWSLIHPGRTIAILFQDHLHLRRTMYFALS